MSRAFRSSILTTTALAVVVLAGGAFARPGVAADGGFHGGTHAGGPPAEHWGHESPPWGHGDVRRFQEHDLERWRGGHWVHGSHVGRFGWWWVVDGAWLYYPVPIYPYPNPYMPPAVAAPPSPGYWYYCPSVNQYYPYVSECPEGWQPVVPSPPS